MHRRACNYSAVSSRGLRLDLNDPLFTRSSPISAIRGVERGWFRSTMGRIRLRQICTPPNATDVAFAERGGGKKGKGSAQFPSFVTASRSLSPLAPFMNILGILMRFPTTILIHEFGPTPSSSSRTPVVLVVDDDVSASLGTPTVHAERASNSPNRWPNIKRDVNESREKDPCSLLLSISTRFILRLCKLG